VKAFEIIIPVLALIEPSLADLILEELVGGRGGGGLRSSRKPGEHWA